MRLLLDTHALAWWLGGQAELSRRAHSAIGDPGNEIFVSAVSAWEIVTNHLRGKWPEVANLAKDVGEAVDRQGFKPLPLSIRHAQIAAGLPQLHRDPFDRMLVAQASIERMTVISADTVFDGYGVGRLW